tara:strand:- start:35 stop:229 length:195 start_codon:yes stop_codon:yes gene_type:complete
MASLGAIGIKKVIRFNVTYALDFVGLMKDRGDFVLFVLGRTIKWFSQLMVGLVGFASTLLKKNH